MRTLNTINPTTGLIIEQYPLMSQPEVDSILQTTNTVQQTWAKSPMALRQQCLLQLAQLLRTHQVEAATLITHEMGKPITQAMAEIEKCAQLAEYYAQEGPAFLKPEPIKTHYAKSYRAFQPLGVIFAIMPWNFPFWQVLRFAVPNLLAGNAGILKHAPNSTGTALYIEALMLKAGFPENLFRSLIIDIDLAPFVIHHKAIAGVTLTGSNRAGKSVAQEAGSALKKVVLELGGSDPYVILDDADLALAVDQCVSSRLNNTGQVCIAAKRIIVTPSIKTAFLELLLTKVQSYPMGNPLDPDTQLGPLAREDLRTTLHQQVQFAIAAGASCLVGGALPTSPGYFYPATVLTNVTSDSPAFQEELFGPIICITEARNEADAILLANHTPFGLGAAIFTQDIQKGERYAKDYFEAGTCAVNTLVSSNPRLPFGGIKQSGYGRELSIEGIREFMNIKTVIVA